MNTHSAIAIDAPAALLARADLILLAASLLRPPAGLDRNHWSDARDALDDLIATADVHAPDLRSALHDALTSSIELAPGLHSAEYHRLFEGKLLCPPNQTAYVRRDKGAVLADICGFYHAFGFDFRSETAEKPDHVVTELEFCGVLLAMIAAAPDEDRATIAAEALAGFADCHLGEWLAWFAARLAAVSQVDFYSAAAGAVMAAWQAIGNAHSLRIIPSTPMAQPEQTPDDPYECAGKPT